MAKERFLWQAQYGSICAGFIAERTRIIASAPILAWARGATPLALDLWLLSQGGTMQLVERFDA